MNHASGAAGSFALNGYMDDYAMWDTALSAGQVKALTTAPALLTGYNAGVMNGLFNAYATQGSSIVGTMTWTYNSSINVTGHSLGDTWLGAGGNYYMWLEGSSAGLVGTLTSIPEPGTYGLLAGGMVLFMISGFRRNALGRRGRNT